MIVLRESMVVLPCFNFNKLKLNSYFSEISHNRNLKAVELKKEIEIVSKLNLCKLFYK